MSKKKPKIYVFLNSTSGNITQRAAVAEDGACLAAYSILAGKPELARLILGEKSENDKAYRQYYQMAMN
jgi:hypothetical protein